MSHLPAKTTQLTTSLEILSYQKRYMGSAYYINRDVTIKSRLDSTNDLLIYTGRLKSTVMNNDETVTLTITAKNTYRLFKDTRIYQ